MPDMEGPRYELPAVARVDDSVVADPQSTAFWL